MGTDDRRRFKRQRKQSIVHFQVVESKGEPGPDQEGTMLDYSLGGMRFSAKEPIKKNTKIYIKLESEEWGKELTVVWRNPNRSLMEVIGSVMWCLESPETPGEFEVGARFVGDLEQ
jgi:PilZ domain